MIRNYTQEAKQRCLSLIDKDIETIWDSIEQMPTDSDAEKWKKKLQQIAKEYTFSSCFALLRIFLDRANTFQQNEGDSPNELRVSLSDGSICRIEDVTIEHTTNLSEEELQQFEKYLLEQAALQSDADYIVDSAIIRKALFPVQKKTTLLTRNEAFQLGHILQFSLQEMEWFLLRVFDVEDGLYYNTSNDLIEAYGFLSKISWKAVSRIKDEYSRQFGPDKVIKAESDSKEDDWTRDVGDSLPERVRSWSIFDQGEQDTRFLQWIGEKAPYLDLPSKTATRIYRNLAVFAHNLAIQTEFAPDVDNRTLRKGRTETDFVRCIREIVQMKDYADQTIDALFMNGEIDSGKCKQIANTLLLENMDFSFSDQTDKTKAWHVIQVMTDGRMTVSGGINASRSRLKDILTGKVDRIEKSDLLYLLWFTSNLCWFDGKRDLTPEDTSNRLNDFIDASELCLDAAGMPEFYPPHLVEQSMMLSVIFAFSSPEKCDPAEVYEIVCSSVIERRAKHTNKKKTK